MKKARRSGPSRTEVKYWKDGYLTLPEDCLVRHLTLATHFITHVAAS
jgi:hypothetical protein